MFRFIYNVIFRIIILHVIITKTYSFRASLFMHPSVPGLPRNTDPTTTPSTTVTTPLPKGPYLLDNYIPPVMQALAYYVELLQYETTETTTIEPPLNLQEVQMHTTYQPAPSTTPPPEFSTTTTTTKKPWWQPATTTQRPSTTTIVWWKPPVISTTTTTKKPSTIVWWQPSSTLASPTSTNPPPTYWWQTTKPPKPSVQPCTTDTPTTTKRPSTIWWRPPSTSTSIPTQMTTPWWQFISKSTTRKPTTTADSVQHTTPFHMPGLFAPRPPHKKPSTQPPTLINNNEIDISSEKESSSVHPTTSDFLNWFLKPKAKDLKPDTEYDFQLLDPLPGSLIHDILSERYEPPTLSDSDNVKEFLRLYDDYFGRYHPLTGKKKVPVTKPYVEFLILYDILKREAKNMKLNKYEGYTPRMLRELAETSTRSAERQLHTLMTRLLVREDVKRNDVVNRIKSIIKDLENPDSATSKALRYLPPLQFA